MKSGQLLRQSMYASLLLASCFAGNAWADEFSYNGDHGPGFWSETPGWEACGRSTEPGARQTPIDIRDTVADPHLRRLDLHILETEIALTNNGHTIEQEYENGSELVLNGAVYELQQFHFHALSEHAVHGHRGVMEQHAVFKNLKDGTMAVVGVIYELGPKSHFLDRLINAGLPQKSGDEDALRSFHRSGRRPDRHGCLLHLRWFAHDTAVLGDGHVVRTQAPGDVVESAVRGIQPHPGQQLPPAAGTQRSRRAQHSGTRSRRLIAAHSAAAQSVPLTEQTENGT
jgi:carbonic anhydrase